MQATTFSQHGALGHDTGTARVVYMMQYGPTAVCHQYVRLSAGQTLSTKVMLCTSGEVGWKASQLVRGAGHRECEEVVCQGVAQLVQALCTPEGGHTGFHPLRQLLHIVCLHKSASHIFMTWTDYLCNFIMIFIILSMPRCQMQQAA